MRSNALECECECVRECECMKFQFISIFIYFYTCIYTYSIVYIAVVFDQNFELIVFTSLFSTPRFPIHYGIIRTHARLHCNEMRVCYDDNNLMSIYILKLNV